MQPPPRKICPQCQRPATLESAFCTGCGRQYRTQFTPNQVPLPQQTLYVPPPVEVQPAKGPEGKRREEFWCWLALALGLNCWMLFPAWTGFLAVAAGQYGIRQPGAANHRRSLITAWVGMLFGAARMWLWLAHGV